MADFINTIDVLGDDTVIDSIIERNITEFKDDTVTTVGQRAFCNCTSLTTADLPNVTKVGQYAFFGCAALKSVNLPQATSFDGYIFKNCSSLETVIAPNLTVVGISMFEGCESFSGQLLDFSKISRVMTYGFCNCKSLDNPKFQNLTTIDNDAFRACTFSIIDLPSVTSIDGNRVFYMVDNLKAVILRRSDVMCALSAPLLVRSNTLIPGYIYAPRALLSDTDATMDYRRATNWSAHAAQFRALEDYTVDGTTTGELDETKIAA